MSGNWLAGSGRGRGKETKWRSPKKQAKSLARSLSRFPCSGLHHTDDYICWKSAAHCKLGDFSVLLAYCFSVYTVSHYSRHCDLLLSFGPKGLLYCGSTAFLITFQLIIFVRYATNNCFWIILAQHLTRRFTIWGRRGQLRPDKPSCETRLSSSFVAARARRLIESHKCVA